MQRRDAHADASRRRLTPTCALSLTPPLHAPAHAARGRSRHEIARIRFTAHVPHDVVDDAPWSAR